MRKNKQNQSNFRLDKEILEEVKKISQKNKKPITKIIEEALELYINRQE
jgi:predicted DNA-binding protein